MTNIKNAPKAKVTRKLKLFTDVGIGNYFLLKDKLHCKDSDNTAITLEKDKIEVRCKIDLIATVKCVSLFDAVHIAKSGVNWYE